jgi:hypothetical protein
VRWSVTALYSEFVECFPDMASRFLFISFVLFRWPHLWPA